jgi:hypothetical protein
MNAVIPAATARRLMASMLAKTWQRPLRRYGRNGRARRREECSMGKIQVNDPIMPRPGTSLQPSAPGH